MQNYGVLVFAGYDPSAGAGILQDVHILRMGGIYAFGIITAMVYENTCRVKKVYPMDIDAQIELAKEEDIKFRIFKLGLVYSKEQLDSILRFTFKIKPEKIVVDPIFQASSKSLLTHLTPEDYIDFLRQTDSILMPNMDEFKMLFKDKPFEDAAIQNKTDIILKSFKVSSSEVLDLLIEKNGHITPFRHKKLKTSDIHGTGCTIASLLSLHLLTYKDIKKAYMYAIRDFEKLIKHTINAGCQRIII